MHAPRLDEEQARPVLNLVQHNDTLRAVLGWVHDLLAEKQQPDTSIEWEDGEEHEDEAVAD
ncbi:MAG: hypothetical protein ABIO40_06675 [Devosia sp.]